MDSLDSVLRACLEIAAELGSLMEAKPASPERLRQAVAAAPQALRNAFTTATTHVPWHSQREWQRFGVHLKDLAWRTATLAEFMKRRGYSDLGHYVNMVNRSVEEAADRETRGTIPWKGTWLAARAIVLAGHEAAGTPGDVPELLSEIRALRAALVEAAVLREAASKRAEQARIAAAAAPPPPVASASIGTVAQPTPARLPREFLVGRDRPSNGKTFGDLGEARSWAIYQSREGKKVTIWEGTPVGWSPLETYSRGHLHCRHRPA